MRSQDSQAAVALRTALGSPWPELQRAARGIVQKAFKNATIAEASERLKVSRATLERIRADYPGDFTPRELTDEERSERSRAGGLARAKELNAKERSDIARQGANARGAGKKERG